MRPVLAGPLTPGRGSTHPRGAGELRQHQDPGTHHAAAPGGLAQGALASRPVRCAGAEVACAACAAGAVGGGLRQPAGGGELAGGGGAGRRGGGHRRAGRPGPLAPAAVAGRDLLRGLHRGHSGPGRPVSLPGAAGQGPHAARRRATRGAVQGAAGPGRGGRFFPGAAGASVAGQQGQGHQPARHALSRPERRRVCAGDRDAGPGGAGGDGAAHQAAVHPGCAGPR